jgi:ATP-dependent DNA helicase RecQ
VDIDKVAEERNIKPATIYAHLTSCIGAEKVDVADVLDFSQSELQCLQDTLIFYKEEGLNQLSPVYNGLGGNYSYEILRMIRASIKDDA